ncbi:heptosyltransferase I [Burkholderiales bacterium]|nr:heptosyltransferase I [Burkholderiales bacterium]
MSGVLVVRPSSLGDVVWALAVARDIAEARPGLDIDWVVEEAFVALPAMCRDVRRVVPLALRRWRHAPLSRATWRAARAFRADLRERTYDAVLDLQEQVKGGVLSRVARGTRHGFDRASIREPVAAWFDDVHHAVPRDLHFATRCRRLAGAALGYTVEGPPRWRWNVPPGPAGAPARPCIVAVHASSRADKRWPADRWRALLSHLDSTGVDVLLPHGSDGEEADARALAAGHAGARLTPRMTLGEMAGLIARAHAVVGVDTGLTHLAAALGTPTLALFTVTDASRAGVAIAGAHARDLGGRGAVPEVDAARAALGELVRAAPRC